VFYVISPPNRTDWRFDRDVLRQRLVASWPGVQIAYEGDRHPARDIVWTYWSDGDELTGQQDTAGQAQYLRGPLELVAEYAAWWRSQVDIDQQLILYDESYATVVPLLPGIDASQIVSQFNHE
jgi:hypothetical protein